MNGPEHILWDSSVFIRYLTESPKERVDDIARYITDAREGCRQIYYSTIAYAEIRQRSLKSKNYSSISRFFRDFGKAFNPLEPTPNILIAAGELRDHCPTNPSPNTPNSRAIGTADAIHLMTCIHARDVLGISEIVFHTFDHGRGKTWEGKCVPLIGFEKWFPPEHQTGRISEVCSLKRSEPIYPDKDLISGN